MSPAKDKSASTAANLNHESNVAAAAQVKDAIAVLLGEHDTFSADRASLVTRVEQLQLLPVSNADAKAFMCELIDKGAAEFAKASGWADLFGKIARPQSGYDASLRMSGQIKSEPSPLNLQFIDKALAGTRQDVASMLNGAADNFFMGRTDTPLSIHSPLRFYFFFGEQIKAKIEEHFDAFYPQYGTEPNPTDTLQERRSTIAGLHQRIARIDYELTNIALALKELGHSAPAACPSQS